VAAANSLSLQVATPLGMQLDLEVDSVQVPSAAGEFGVLPNHVPLLAALRPGILRYHQAGKAVAVAVGAGYAEADATRVKLIAEFFARPEDVNADEAKKDLEAADQKLKAFHGQFGDAAHRKLQEALDWARARLDLIAS
jgi:F-type H+-transporting ATPase subunit epsilon